MDYLLPVIGTLTPPATTLILERHDEGRYWLSDAFLGGVVTGISYVFGRTAAYFVNHYS